MGQSQTCPRCRKDCVPLSNVVADDIVNGAPASFICVGYNDGKDRVVKGDQFTHCWKNEEVDLRSHWDRRDLLDTVSVMSQALAIDENIRVGEGLTDDQMNEANLTADAEAT